MDNLGDWLYIVLLVIAAVSGIFSSGKKKNKPGAKPVSPQQRAGDPQNFPREKGFWEVLEDMQNETRPAKKPVAAKVPPAKTVARKKTASPSPFLTAESSIPGLQAAQNNPILFEDVHNDPHRVTSDDFHPQDVDEVRKAIIYSEILNRKYQ